MKSIDSEIVRDHQKFLQKTPDKAAGFYTTSIDAKVRKI